MAESGNREKLHSNALTRVSDAIVSLNSDLEYIFVNPEAERLLDTTEENLRGTYIWDAFPEEANTIAEDKIKKANETGQDQTYERYNETVDRWFEARVYPDEGGVSIFFTDISDRKERELELKQYEQIIESLPVAVGMNTPGEEGKFEFVNQAAVDMLGASSKAELQDYAPGDVYANADERKQLGKKLEESGSVEQYEAQLTTLDGDPFWGSITADLTEIGGDEYFIGIIEQISERKAREQELTENKERIAEQNHALESFTEIVADSNRTVRQQVTDLLELGSTYLNLDVGVLSEIDGSEYTIRNAVGSTGGIEVGDTLDITDTYCSLVYDADGPVSFHTSDDGGVKDHPVYREQGIESYIGVPVWVDGQRYGTLNFSQSEARQDPFTDGEESFVRIMSQWIGAELERQQHQQELERTSEFLRETQEVASVGGWEFDLRSEDMRWSDEVYRIHGLPLDADISPEEGIEFYHRDDKDTINNAFNSLTTEGEPYDLELRLVTADDELRWVRTRGAPQYEDDEIVRVKGTFQDITERKERENELQKQYDRLDEFTGVISHDLRNPLNIAQGRIDIVKQECDSDSLEPIDRSLDRMESIVEDTLTLARQGQTVGELNPISIVDIVDGCWSGVATAEASLEIDTEFTIYGDRDRLRHVFENLFRNAIEHGNGNVTVRVGRADEDRFYVEDDGPGIPVSDREKVLEAGHTSASGGTGLGLTIIKRIAEAHGWEVTITEGDSGGARFEFGNVELLND